MPRFDLDWRTCGAPASTARLVRLIGAGVPAANTCGVRSTSPAYLRAAARGPRQAPGTAPGPRVEHPRRAPLPTTGTAFEVMRRRHERCQVGYPAAAGRAVAAGGTVLMPGDHRLSAPAPPSTTCRAPDQDQRQDNRRRGTWRQAAVDVGAGRWNRLEITINMSPVRSSGDQLRVVIPAVRPDGVHARKPRSRQADEPRCRNPELIAPGPRPPSLPTTGL